MSTSSAAVAAALLHTVDTAPITTTNPSISSGGGGVQVALNALLLVRSSWLVMVTHEGGGLVMLGGHGMTHRVMRRVGMVGVGVGCGVQRAQGL